MNNGTPSGRRQLIRWCGRLTATLLVCCLTTSSLMALARAQVPEQWTDPVSLTQEILNDSGQPAQSFAPVLAADVWGNVHALWPTRIHGEADSGIGDTLYYTHWDGTSWSAPVDIFYMPGQLVWLPRAAVDQQGWLHVSWTSGDGRILYSSAPVTKAGSAQAWSQPVEVMNAGAPELSIAIEPDGTVHLIYCAMLTDGGVYHTSSSDGEIWSAPSLIGYSTGKSCRSRHVIDDTGRIHVVWGQHEGRDLDAEAVYYARSDDGGLSWHPPVEIDRLDERYRDDYAPGNPSVWAIDQDEVHVVWYGAPRGQRWHRWSGDGGNTWSSPTQLSSDLRFFTDPAAMGADSLGTLHMVTFTGDETAGSGGLYYAYWRDGHWSPLTRIAAGDERADLAVSKGNVLHAAWDVLSDQGFSNWTARIETEAPAVAPEPVPTRQVTPTAHLVSSATAVSVASTSQATPTATKIPVTPTTIVNEPRFPPDASSEFKEWGQQTIMLISLLPAILILGLVIMVYRSRGRYRT